jgi:hypothetical protein
MSTIDPAFPVVMEQGGYVQAPGLTKREYFAAAAMLGMLNHGTKDDSDIPLRAVVIADRMIEALTFEPVPVIATIKTKKKIKKL